MNVQETTQQIIQDYTVCAANGTKMTIPTEKKKFKLSPVAHLHHKYRSTKPSKEVINIPSAHKRNCKIVCSIAMCTVFCVSTILFYGPVTSVSLNTPMATPLSQAICSDLWLADPHFNHITSSKTTGSDFILIQSHTVDGNIFFLIP